MTSTYYDECLEKLQKVDFFINEAFREYPPQLVFSSQIEKIKSNLNMKLKDLTEGFNILTYMISHKEIDFKLLDNTLDLYEKTIPWHQRALKSLDIKESDIAKTI